MTRMPLKLSQLSLNDETPYLKWYIYQFFIQSSFNQALKLRLIL